MEQPSEYSQQAAWWGVTEGVASGEFLSRTRVNVVECELRSTTLTVIVNGERALEWSGNFKRLTNPANDYYSVPDPKALYLGNWGACKFLSAKMDPIVGRGIFTR